MIEEKNGFAFLEGQLLFSLTPEDIVWRMRDGWLNDIQKGNNVLVDVILPYLEREAISRLGKEWTIQKESAPSMKGGYDNWRLWWLNEASHNCDSHDPIGEAGRHLSPIGQHAVNILITASALRDALDAGNATESAALAMMLICEALAGGQSRRYEAAVTAIDTAEEARRNKYKKTIGAESEDHERARLACISAANKIWDADPDRRIGDVSRELNSRLLQNFDKLPSLDLPPTPDTIKGWLKDAAKAGKLTIPEAAQRRGRPSKQER